MSSGINSGFDPQAKWIEMARRANYGFEKRQKEIKKEQKRQAKLEKKHGQKTAESDASTTEQGNDQLNHNQQQDRELE